MIRIINSEICTFGVRRKYWLVDFLQTVCVTNSNTFRSLVGSIPYNDNILMYVRTRMPFTRRTTHLLVDVWATSEQV